MPNRFQSYLRWEIVERYHPELRGWLKELRERASNFDYLVRYLSRHCVRYIYMDEPMATMEKYSWRNASGLKLKAILRVHRRGQGRILRVDQLSAFLCKQWCELKGRGNRWVANAQHAFGNKKRGGRVQDHSHCPYLRERFGRSAALQRERLYPMRNHSSEVRAILGSKGFLLLQSSRCREDHRNLYQ